MTKVEYNFEEMGVSRERLKEVLKGNTSALFFAFSWLSSPQGFDYWDRVYGGNRPLDPDLLKDMLEQYDAWVESKQELKVVDSVSLLGEHEGVMDDCTYELVYDFPDIDQEHKDELKSLFKAREETLEVGIRGNYEDTLANKLPPPLLSEKEYTKDFPWHKGPEVTNLPSEQRSQVGGSHYQGEGIEPIDFIMSNNLSFPQGSVIKYVFRYKDKNGIEDLEKAKQYIDFMISELRK